MKYYRAPDVVFANVNGTDIAIGNGLDFDSCEDFIFRQIAVIDSLDKAAEEMGFPDGKELIEYIAINGENEDFYKQIVMDRYHGEKADDY